ncbi:hypothetical protein F4820DRAFT_439108 [Hypoxylon rubiginosum]|uniref:Uncharacterized protein n=1 Tax=Hypoxylon rubiginosum TaxID=110542 RepID=A0ACB9YL28_9PEZI|nr:hypothetical protein F4820DRAFT_439108 [Hypoxylon rubiginosum]
MMRDLSSSVLIYLGDSVVTVNDCEAFLRRISDFHLPTFDDGPHVLVHGDLHPSNIIINEQQVEW